MYTWNHIIVLSVSKVVVRSFHINLHKMENVVLIDVGTGEGGGGQFSVGLNESHEDFMNK